MQGSEESWSSMQMHAFTDVLAVPFVLKAVIELDIPDVLAKSENSLHYTKIASQTPSKSNPELVHRLLQFLVRRTIFEEEEPGVFKHNPLSRSLIKNNPHSVAPVIMWAMCDPILSSWKSLHLLATSKSGEEPSAFSVANNMDMFKYARSNMKFSKVLIQGLRSNFVPISMYVMSVIMENYRGFKDAGNVLVDVGGGNRACGAMIKKVYPNLKIINYDLPDVLKFTQPAPGLEHKGGDMFESVPQGDAIFLKQVLHNWNDEKCKVILQNCHKALPENGKLIIVDMITNSNEKNGGDDLDMLMLVLTGGKERNEEEWKDLLVTRGFTSIKFIRFPKVKEGIIEAYKKSHA